MKCCATVPTVKGRRLCQREAVAGETRCWQHREAEPARPTSSASPGSIRPFRCLEWGLTDESRRQILREMGA